VGKIQAKYGIVKEEAEKQVDAFTHKCADGYDHETILATIEVTVIVWMTSRAIRAEQLDK